MAERTVAIVGLGLMGGSLGLALKRAVSAPRVLGVDPDPGALQRALERGAIDRDASIAGACQAADIVVLAAPPDVVVELIEQHAESLANVPLLTDLSSVKETVLDAAARAGLAASFVGGHPMAGRERAGIDAAVPDLYEDATVWLVAGSAEAPVDQAAVLWQTVGARPVQIAAVAHDRLMARISHTPQIVASGLATALARSGASSDLLGPGGRDATRIAASPVRLWTEILIANRARVLEPLDSVLGVLASYRSAIANGDAETLAALLREGRAWRDHEGPPS